MVEKWCENLYFSSHTQNFLPHTFSHQSSISLKHLLERKSIFSNCHSLIDFKPYLSLSPVIFWPKKLKHGSTNETNKLILLIRVGTVKKSFRVNDNFFEVILSFHQFCSQDISPIRGLKESEIYKRERDREREIERGKRERKEREEREREYIESR